MSYYFNQIVNTDFDTAIERVIEELKKEGFGVLTEIDVQAAMRKKLGKDFRKYKILGACNPPFAYQALKNEDKIGTMLPCNVIIQETENGEVEVAAIDPIASMQAVDNPKLADIAHQVRAKMEKVINAL